MKSSWSLASSFASSSSSEPPEAEFSHASTTVSSAVEPEPPVYDDPCHPWSSSHIRTVDDGEEDDKDEEERELLPPPYKCTVSRAGEALVKREREDEHTLSAKRSWKTLYVVVWGTSIRAYKRRPKHPETAQPVWCFSTEHAEAGMASDYLKHPDVVRVRIRDGPQFLIRCSTYMGAVLWIDAIQASANVCEDLDTRSMPEFSFGRRMRRSRPRR